MSFNYYHIRTDDFSAHTGGGYGVVITRDNYEAYFVMYVDDELNATERKAVEAFIEQNPDLEEEMIMLQQSVLRADDDIVFEQKEVLFKGADQFRINEQNCEEYFVLYGDDELTNAEKEKVEQFVYHHPQYQAEFELIQQIKLLPDNALNFPDKNYLYRTEEDDNRIPAFPWWRFTAAAIAILVIGTLAWFIVSNTHAGNQDVAEKTPSVNSTNGTNTPLQDVTPNNDHSGSATNEGMAVTETPARVNTTTGTKQPENVVVNNIQKNISEPGNKEKAQFVKHIETQSPEQDPENNNNAITPKPVFAVVDNSTEKIAVKNTVIKNTVTEQLAVNTVAAKTIHEDEADQSSTYVLNAPINKTPLRGFFRKVSRVVEKVTNPEDNGKKGIRIANLEIALN
jgi:hypothetical protein